MKYLEKARNILVWIFMISMIIYPLYMKNGFVKLATAKKEYFYIVACGLLLPALLLSIIIYIFHSEKKTLHTKFLTADYFAIAYTAVICISTFTSSYRDTAISGASSWYMGLITQLLFLLVYFVISRNFKFSRLWLFGLFGAAAIIYVLCVLARFHINLFDLYTGRDEDFWNAYIPTIGQKNWYACFMAIVLPMELGYFLIRKNKKLDIILIPLIFVSTMAMVMQDSDSIYVCMLFVLLFLFEVFCSNLDRLRRFFLMLTIAFLAMQALGVIQILFADQMVSLSSTVTTVCQNNIFRLIGVIIAAIWLALTVLSFKLSQEQTEKVDSIIPRIKRVILIIAALTIVGLILLIILVTNLSDIIDFGSLAESKYFMFDDSWGTYRGMNWSMALTSYGELNIWQKLFGVGPDCYYSYMSTHHSTFTNQWSSAITNAHNELLTSLVNTGLLGALCYFGIFVSLIKEAVRQKKRNPILIALAAGIVGFLFNNLFSFMNIISTPLLFTVAGCISALIRSQKESDRLIIQPQQ